MRDPGDEHPGDGTVGGIVGWAYACPLCHERISAGSRWRTPLRVFRSFLESVETPPRDHDDLETCRAPECLEQARRFAVQHALSPAQKSILVYARWH